MSKRGYISRYSLIVRKLKQKPYATFEELQTYIEDQLDYMQVVDDDLKMGFSKRTLQRDIQEIRKTFGIDIEYSKGEKGYFIRNEEADNLNFHRMIESFDLYNALNLSQDMGSYVHLEKRKPQGTENLHGLLHAIKNRVQIQFAHQKFWEHVASQRTAEPYALKEYRNRWYLMAKDHRDQRIKSFALDRLSQLIITQKPFLYPEAYSVEAHYRYCFGIVSPDEIVPEDIILAFTPHQGKYIKTLPLHDTQEVLADNEKELRIGLKLCITHDFLMELLSFGANMKILEPQSLAQQIKEAHEKAFRQYE